MRAKLFFGHLADNDEDHDKHQAANYDPAPHSATHPSVYLVHHVLLLSFLLQIAHHSTSFAIRPLRE
jgi:hypothetical protein